MSSAPLAPPAGGLARPLLAAAAAAAVLVLAVRVADAYLNDPSVPRPHDFLQVWSAGRLTLSGQNPYDGEAMYRLQMANRSPSSYASMMWVPPWGLAVAMPVGALPVAAAQGLWVFGQFAAVVIAAVLVWRAGGGAAGRWWVPAALAVGFGPLWWQTYYGQYGGVLLVGVVGFLLAHRAGRPGLAGAFAALTALKPHLFLLFAVGLGIDALRSPFGRRVVLGGLAVLLTAAAAATVANPGVWREYLAAAGGSGSAYYPSLSVWFNPTVQAWARYCTPGQPMWVQFVPAAVAVPWFAAYWWRRGGPEKWPEALLWVLPAGLLLAPYGSWPSDLVLLLVPVVAVAARADAGGWAVQGRWVLLGAYAAANLGVVVLMVVYTGTAHYAWVGPVVCACALWVADKPRPEPAR
jgi:hypothetical protein